jgi:hypothetical protein
MKTLVIHPQDPSTAFLSTIYAGKGYDVLTSYKGDLNELLPKYSRVIMLGHGWSPGLFSMGRFRGTFIINDESVPGLKHKNNVYIWCHASDFVGEYGLKGFATGMFCSEVGEATARYSSDASGNRPFQQAVRQSHGQAHPEPEPARNPEGIQRSRRSDSVQPQSVEAVPRKAGNMSESKTTVADALYAILFYYIIFVWIPNAWYSKTRFAFQYSLEYDQVTVDKKPHDCDWLRAPLGDKECKYNREVSVQEVKPNAWGGQSTSIDEWKTQSDFAMNANGEHIYSSDKGKTWMLDPYYSGPRKPAVSVYWTKKEDQ